MTSIPCGRNVAILEECRIHDGNICETTIVGDHVSPGQLSDSPSPGRVPGSGDPQLRKGHKSIRRPEVSQSDIASRGDTMHTKDELAQSPNCVLRVCH